MPPVEKLMGTRMSDRVREKFICYSKMEDWNRQFLKHSVFWQSVNVFAIAGIGQAIHWVVKNA